MDQDLDTLFTRVADARRVAETAADVVKSAGRMRDKADEAVYAAEANLNQAIQDKIEQQMNAG